MGSPTDEDLHLDELKQLILRAYEEARDSGKADWDLMRSAVLKNRLLQLTDREFNEDRYGGGTMVAVALRIPGLLELASSQPAVLRLADPTVISTKTAQLTERKSATSHPTWQQVRIRPDLWRALVTPRPESTYVWDITTGQAREVTVLDEPDQLVLPSITAQEMTELRQAFRREHGDDRLDEWVEAPSERIPKRIQTEWRSFLKSHTVSRIQQWFQQHDLPAPVDLIQYTTTSDLPTTADVVRTRTLKSALLRAVQLMTDDELRQVLVPAAVLMRYEQER